MPALSKSAQKVSGRAMRLFGSFAVGFLPCQPRHCSLGKNPGMRPSPQTENDLTPPRFSIAHTLGVASGLTQIPLCFDICSCPGV